MDIEKVKEIIKGSISSAKGIYEMQDKMHKKDHAYAVPDYGWYEGRISAFNEVLGLLGMIDKPNNK
jgi:hypothetical protein